MKKVFIPIIICLLIVMIFPQTTNAVNAAETTEIAHCSNPIENESDFETEIMSEINGSIVSHLLTVMIATITFAIGMIIGMGLVLIVSLSNKYVNKRMKENEL